MTQRPREGIKTEFAERKDESKQNRRYDRESVRSALCRIFFLYYNSQEMGDFICTDRLFLMKLTGRPW